MTAVGSFEGGFRVKEGPAMSAVQGLAFREKGIGWRVSGLRFWVQRYVTTDQGFEIGVEG